MSYTTCSLLGLEAAETEEKLEDDGIEDREQAYRIVTGSSFHSKVQFLLSVYLSGVFCLLVSLFSAVVLCTMQV